MGKAQVVLEAMKKVGKWAVKHKTEIAEVGTVVGHGVVQKRREKRAAREAAAEQLQLSFGDIKEIKNSVQQLEEKVNSEISLLQTDLDESIDDLQKEFDEKIQGLHTKLDALCAEQVMYQNKARRMGIIISVIFAVAIVAVAVLAILI